eukprot:Gb_17282 [translate_table: standard]
MIRPQTYLNVADNSGARKLMCIRVLGVSNRQYAHIGDVIIAIVKEAIPNMPLKESEIVRAVVVRTCKELERDNGMTLRWKCIESRVNGKRLHYGRFALSPLQKGQANTIGIAMRRALLGEVEGTCITHAKFENMTHEYSAIMGIEESVHDISINLRGIVLQSDPYGIREASIYSVGPRDVTAQDIILPPSVRIIDTTQHIASLKESITSDIRSQIGKDRGYHVRGQVVSWSSAGACGFKGTKRSTPFATQTAAERAIRTLMDQGMERAEVMISGPGPGRDTALRAIRRSGQANTIGIAMQRALLGEVEGTCITHVKFENMRHEYSAIMGIEESVHDISINLRGIVLQSDPYRIREASIYSIGPRDVIAQDIILPPFSLNNSRDGIFSTDVVSMPVRNVNYSIHSYGNGNEMQEILFSEIWTNGSLAPEEALYEASQNFIDLFIPFMHVEEQNIDGIDNWNGYNMSLFPFSHISTDIEKMEEEITFKHIFIDQLELPPRVYNCLKRVNIHTLSDLLNYSRDDPTRIENFGKQSVEQILEVLQKRFAIDLPKKKFQFH